MPLSHALIIRDAEVQDSEQIIILMKKLAVFEGYIEQFNVTQEELIERCFVNQEFFVIVAQKNGKLLGLLVYYFAPFTFDLTPWLFIKELFIDDSSRGQNVGNNLMLDAIRKCKEKNSAKMYRNVLANNSRARYFYEKFGARQSVDWIGYEIAISCNR